MHTRAGVRELSAGTARSSTCAHTCCSSLCLQQLPDACARSALLQPTSHKTCSPVPGPCPRTKAGRQLRKQAVRKLCRLGGAMQTTWVLRPLAEPAPHAARQSPTCPPVFVAAGAAGGLPRPCAPSPSWRGWPVAVPGSTHVAAARLCTSRCRRRPGRRRPAARRPGRTVGWAAASPAPGCA